MSVKQDKLSDEIIENVKVQYRRCQTYKDSGTIYGAEGTLKFSTYFARPDKFRFDWIYSSPNADLSSFRTNGGPSLVATLNAAINISQGMESLICSLLMPEISGLQFRGLSEMKNYKLYLSETENSELCHKLLASSPNSKRELWIRECDNAICKQLYDSIADQAEDDNILKAINFIAPDEEQAMRKHLSERSEQDRHHIVVAMYDFVAFDAPIEGQLFQNS